VHTSTGLDFMTTRLAHALEVSDASATLYLSGTLSGADAFQLRGVCRDIPGHVRTLRLDMKAVTRLEEGAMDTVRALIRYWRESRQGGFRLSFASEQLVATMVEDGLAETRASLAEQFGGRAAALTGMFL
jgi:ABC-type transporter Mla MlaB component